METHYGRGFHTPKGHAPEAAAYDAYLGRWSRLLVPNLIAAAQVTAGDRVLDVATGLGEAAAGALLLLQDSGAVVGADISQDMLIAARTRLASARFFAVV